MTRLQAVRVVVPAHDEELLLPRALAALAEAVDRAREAHSDLDVRVAIVLDRCTDGSAAVVAAHAAHGHRVDALVPAPGEAGSVGRARAHGVRRAVPVGVDPARVWVASTDADSAVPADWLVSHVRAAAEGADLVVGPVHPDPADLSRSALAQWWSHHREAPDGRHVHGANLGVRLDRYLAAGGFASVAEHEDVRLVEAVLATGARSAPGPAVLTSGRSHGRTPGGFAGYLRALGNGLEPLRPPPDQGMPSPVVGS